MKVCVEEHIVTHSHAKKTFTTREYFGESLVAVKWSLVGSMYMFLTQAKTQYVILASQMRFMNIYM